MALENLHLDTHRAWALWKIDETEHALANEVSPFEVAPEGVSNPIKRLEFLAGRVLIKTLLRQWNVNFEGLTKDAYGKPFIRNSDIQLSLSHSFPYVAAVVDRHQPVGIDLEQPKDKLLRIGPRVLDESELNNAGTDVVKHCIYWCAKETLIKIYGKKDLHLAEHLKITPFVRAQSGDLIGRIIVGKKETAIALQYIVEENFVVVLNK